MGDKQITDIVYETLVFSLWAVSSSTNVETEVLVYPWTSLVAEFGGTLGTYTYLDIKTVLYCTVSILTILGLFLGFSFMTIWDGMATVADWLTTRRLLRSFIKL